MAEDAPNALSFDTELVANGRTMARPVHRQDGDHLRRAARLQALQEVGA